MAEVEDVVEEAEEDNCLNSAKLADFYVRYLLFVGIWKTVLTKVILILTIAKMIYIIKKML
jgi:hypothetical protein